MGIRLLHQLPIAIYLGNIELRIYMVVFFSLRDCNLEFGMFLRSPSFKITRRGLWSVTIISSLHHKINMHALLRLQEIATLLLLVCTDFLLQL